VEFFPGIRDIAAKSISSENMEKVGYFRLFFNH